MLYDIRVGKINFRDFLIIGLLLGVTVRIPISSTATVSFSEIALIISVLGIPLYLSSPIRFTKLEMKFLLQALVVFSLLFIQSFINFNRIISIVLIFEYLFIGIFLMPLFMRLGFNNSIYYKVIVLFSFYLSINNLYFNVLRYETGYISNVLKFGSSNYTSAIMLLLIPIIYIYIRESIVPKLIYLSYFSIFLMTISIIFSGSRSNIAILLFQIGVFIFLAKESIFKRVKIIISLMILMVTVYFIVISINPELKFIIERYIYFFSNNASGRNDIIFSDIIRQNLITEAKALISQNKWWGTGFARLPYNDMPIHNFVYEIILALGYIGFSVYAVYFIVFVLGILRAMPNYNSVRLLCMVIVVTFLAICLFHPFMTTGKEFTTIFWLSLISFSFLPKKIVNCK